MCSKDFYPSFYPLFLTFQLTPLQTSFGIERQEFTCDLNANLLIFKIAKNVALKKILTTFYLENIFSE